MPSQSSAAPYDVFIAHSSKDKAHARALKTALQAIGLRAFIDEDMLPGTLWDEELPRTQQASRVTVTLISDNFTDAYYAREELVAGIKLSRAKERQHSLIPIYLDGDVPAELPYGLQRVVGISLPGSGGWSKVARRIGELLDALSDPAAVEPGLAAVPDDAPVKGSELVKLADGIASAIVELGIAPASILMAVDFPMHRAPMSAPTAAGYWLEVLRAVNTGILAAGSGRVALRKVVHEIRASAPEVNLPGV